MRVRTRPAHPARYAGFFDTVGKLLPHAVIPGYTFVAAANIPDRLRHALSMPTAKKQAELSILIPCYGQVLREIRSLEARKPSGWRDRRKVLEAQLKTYERNPSACPSYRPPPPPLRPPPRPPSSAGYFAPGSPTDPTMASMTPQIQGEIPAQGFDTGAESYDTGEAESSAAPYVVGALALAALAAGGYYLATRKKSKD